MRKWTYPYLEVLVEQVRKKNEIFRRGSTESGTSDLAERKYGKRNFLSLVIKTERNYGSEASDF